MRWTLLEGWNVRSTDVLLWCSAHKYVHIYIYMNIYIYIYICVFIFICTYTCVYIFIYLYIYIDTHTHIFHYYTRTCFTNRCRKGWAATGERQSLECTKQPQKHQHAKWTWSGWKECLWFVCNEFSAFSFTFWFGSGTGSSGCPSKA